MRNDKISIFWFRRDLRIEDNCGLFHALSSGNRVLPIFIFDTNIIEELDRNDARVTFIHQRLKHINKLLKSFDSSIKILVGTPQNAFIKLLDEYNIVNVYTNRDYEPYAKKRDAEIEQILNKHNIQFKTYKDHVIFEKNEITKPDSSPYKVYTPYSKKWLSTLSDTILKSFNSEKLTSKFIKHNLELQSLEKIGFEESNIKVLPFDISKDLILNYEETRNFPAINKTSKLSPHLRFGAVSIRNCVKKALAIKNTTFLKELIWREFFIQVLWHYPTTNHNNFKSKYDGIQWRNNEQEFKAWCEGKTGYPIVDAGMNELNKTGYMHNRVRMITASFLCKHLLIDWRWGEAYFAKKLLDFDLAQNVGNWQWVAGTGCDAAPYFRIFNPTEQVKKFDKQLEYIKKWVPNFQELSYPTPIVEHKFARNRCLETYKVGMGI